MAEEKKAESYLLTRWLFLRLLGFIHLSAFGSYAFQILGLNGSHGIQPTGDMIGTLSAYEPMSSAIGYPTLALFNSSDAFLQGMTWCGTALSVLLILGVGTAPALLLLTILWLSLVSGGGEFTGFQSDVMLVEASALTLFFAPWQFFEPPWPVPLNLRKQTPPPKISIWLLRLMLFRIMFISGLVKIASGDPTWRDFTAMNYHYETQPIPTPLAWHFHNLPHWVHKTQVLIMYVSELIAPFFIYGPRAIRVLGFLLMCGLHLMIFATGNYTFLSLLMMLLCLLLIDDELLKHILPQSLTSAIKDSACEDKSKSLRRLLYNFAVSTFFLVAAYVSLASMYGKAVILAPFKPLIAVFAALDLSNSYGLFAVMTTTRPEIVFEGSNDGITWKSYEFQCKPGDDLSRAPTYMAPHMPRLDWRLWFAAMQPADGNPWVLELVKRMLDGSPAVMKFFAVNPFPDHPPKFIRAFVYDYHFTNQEEKNRTGNWWRRDNKRVYLPPLKLEGEKLDRAD